MTQANASNLQIKLVENLIAEEQIEQAIAACQQILQLSPDYAEAYQTLGFALKALGKHEDAMNAYAKAGKLYEQSINSDPHAFDTKLNYWHLGLVLLLQRQEEEAQMVWFSAISEGTPEMAENWLRELVEILNIEAKKQETIQDYDTAWLIRQHIHENAPENLDNLYALGKLCVQLDQVEEAIAYFRTCIAINPDCKAAYQSLSSIYRQQGKIVFILQPQVRLLAIEGSIATKLNLGCGQNLLQGYINVDKFGNPDIRCDLEIFPWIWADNSIDEILLNHVLEHLGSTTEVYLGIVKELYRVCRPNALIYINVPHPRHDDFLNDPTHVRIVTPDNLMLFSQVKNQEWATVGASNSPLGLYLNVDFEIVDFAYTLDEPWFPQYASEEVNSIDMMQNIRKYNNVAKQTEIKLRVIKH